MTYSSHYKSQGVTLIELMIVLIIIAVAFTVGMPGISTMNANTQADRLNDELRLDIAFARNQSVSVAQQIDMQPIGGNWSTGWQIIQNSDNTVLRERGSVASPVAENGTITSPDFTNINSVSFDRKGRAVNTGSFNVLVTGCSGDRSYTLNVNQIGQLVVSEAACP